MKKNIRFPFRFFLMTFMWSWIIWTPLILASLKIIPVSEKVLSIVTIPVIMIGVYGPLAGALFASPFSGLYAHGLANAIIPLIPTIILQKNVSQPRFWIWVTTTFLIGIIITVMRDKKL